MYVYRLTIKLALFLLLLNISFIRMPFILINEFAKPFITDNYIYDEVKCCEKKTHRVFSEQTFES